MQFSSGKVVLFIFIYLFIFPEREQLVTSDPSPMPLPWSWAPQWPGMATSSHQLWDAKWPTAQHEGTGDQGLPHQHHPRAQDLFLGLTRRACGSLMVVEETGPHCPAPSCEQRPLCHDAPSPSIGEPSPRGIQSHNRGSGGKRGAGRADPQRGAAHPQHPHGTHLPQPHTCQQPPPLPI